MKKILSVALASVLLAGSLVIPTSAAQSNVDADALKFTAQPTFDGVISEEEWGPITVTVKGSEAATKEDEGVNAFNTYMEFEEEYVQTGMEFDLWLRWDADYFYIGALVRDPDGFSCPDGGANIWNGDCLQTRIDPWGPSSAMLKKNPDFNYKIDEYAAATMNFESNAKKAWLNADQIINAGFGLVKGLTPQAFDMQAEQLMTDTICAINKVDKGDMVDTFNCETTYEIAIPWATIGIEKNNLTATEGTVLGMSLVMLNSSGASMNAFLTWGSGICGGQAKNARKTAGGSNAVTLSATEVTPAAEYSKLAEDTTEVVTEAATTAKAEAKTEASTTAAEKKDNGPTDYNDVDNSTTIPVWVWIVAAVVVVAVIVIIVVASKKKKKN